MPEPDCFLRYRMHCNAEFYYVGKIPRTGIGHQWCADCGPVRWTGPLADRDPQIFLRTRIIRGLDDWNRLRTRTVRGSKPQ